MFNWSNSDRKSQLSGILTEPLNPRAQATCGGAFFSSTGGSISGDAITGNFYFKIANLKKL